MHTYSIIAGIDEAGLGPVIGPLTLGYSALVLPGALPADALLSANLWQLMGGAIGRKFAEHKQKPIVCDSKVLYTPSRGLRPLEEEVLAWARLAGLDTSSFDALYGGLCRLTREARSRYDWYAQTHRQFPLAASAERPALRAEAIARALDAASLKLAEFGAVAVYEGELNRLIGQTDNKSRAEFEVVGRIMGELWRKHRHVFLVCDRQGGREKYSRALKSQFPEADITVFVETPKISSYELCVRGEADEPRLFVAFIEDGDFDHFPVALASMAAKYLREAMMDLLNDYFCERQPGLERTAGYYTDGMRFLRETQALRQRLGINDANLIRAR